LFWGKDVILGRSEAQTRESRDGELLEPISLRDARVKPEHDAKSTTPGRYD